MDNNEFNIRIKSLGQKLLQERAVYLNSNIQTEDLEFFVCLKINSNKNVEDIDLTLKDLRLFLIAQFVSNFDRFVGQKLDIIIRPSTFIPGFVFVFFCDCLW